MDKTLKRMATMHRMQTAGLELFYANGYYATSVDDILNKLSLSKGAFYYHFESKEDFFVQIIQNLLSRKVYSCLIEPIEGFSNPLQSINSCFEEALETAVHNEMDFGCVLNNFLTEFRGRNEVIMKHLNEILSIWEVNLVSTLQKGKFNGHIDRHVDCEAAATYLMSSYFGIRTLMVGAAPSARKYRFMSQLKMYLKTLEPKKVAV
ncbi:MULTISPECIES: TetR/AcrR family transcriptional regulator [Maribacter]|uniref:TetR/AcrR family transcriptional regulator n=1 Tax=Maribacter flavus TaxID=1658664 RepID=A0A5B2TXI9_9FLAO|nr:MULTISPECIES: TetR/AcrR family transcriptional regulator [Maribacter]KAA2219236.1 TetR/AcrR family transcriptional regulator [Maribacter flavus]MDC6404169.1 TetR/AcrR family transcriptional regulator [Maribacter sp. PR66]MEE1971312.1 TetR/AcrR family transcriptional regulator [Maribacter flavus]